MLSVLFIFLFIGSCHSLYNVSVTVQDGFCLDMYPAKKPATTATKSQLQMEFNVVHSGIQTGSFYFETAFEGFTLSPSPPHISFTKDDNILLDSLIPSLVLDEAIFLPDVSPHDDINIGFDINPVIMQNVDKSKADKCNKTDRIHHQQVSPSSLLQNVVNQTFSEQIVFDLSNTSCLTSTNRTWFTCNSSITVQLDFDCGGPCNELPFTATTTTASTGSTSPGTTSTGTSISTTREPDDPDNHTVPLIVVCVIAALELIFIIGGTVYVLRRLIPNAVKRAKTSGDPSGAHYHAGDQNADVDVGGDATGGYAEAGDPEYARVNKQAKNADRQNSFATNAAYEP